MITFYFLNDTLLYFLLVPLLILVFLQTAFVALSIINYSQNKLLPLFLEIVLLLYIAILASVPAIVATNRMYGVIDTSNYTPLFYAIAIPLIILYITQRKKSNIIIVLALIFTLPIISQIHYNLYNICFFLSLLLFFPRTIQSIKHSFYEYKDEITTFSVRESLNNVQVGIMFYDTAGYIYLSNNKMHEVMIRFFKEDIKNGNDLWKKILQMQIPHAERYEIDTDVVFRTEQDAWRFSKRVFIMDKREYIELIATDVTKIDKNFKELETLEKNLLLQSKEIQKLVFNMVTLSQEQEYARLRFEVHDVMGQRLSALQRMVQAKEYSTYKNAVTLLKNIQNDIKKEHKTSVKQSFQELKTYFNNIGIAIKKEGSFPEKKEIAHLFIAIIREATTNAARHAQSNTVTVTMTHTDGVWSMDITNDGIKPQKEIIDGGGLSGMKKRVENVGGKIYIIYEPIFCISVQVQKSDKKND